MDFLYPILLLPLLGFIVNILWITDKNRNWTAYIACCTVLFAFILSFGYSVDALHAPNHSYWFTWVNLGALRVDFAFRVDNISLWMMRIILGVGFLIHHYSVGYMKNEAGFNRYFAFLNLFIFFMLVLVLSDNLLLAFFGWEGVGLCSYFLIGHFFHKKSARLAANKAFIMNRVGDLGFLLGIFMLFGLTQSLNFKLINSLIPLQIADGTISTTQLTIALLLLFWACIGKSAQFPLFTWLPDAMEGPTPVSALIHAATMVTAGVYLVLRMAPVYSLAPLSGEIIAYTGAFTALIAAFVATQQWDMKKILAYSTISQLGFMFAALGGGAFDSGFFHLSTHAFFKALLFLCAGAILYSLGHEQDIRKMGGLKKRTSFLFWVYAVGAWCLAGLPLGSGFFSKDALLNQLYTNSNFHLAFWMLIASSFLTAFYTYRLMFFTFSDRPAVDPALTKEQPTTQLRLLENIPKVMAIALVLLAIGSVLISVANLPHFLAVLAPQNSITGQLEQLGIFSVKVYSLKTELFVGIVTLTAALAGVTGAWLLFRWQFSTKQQRAFATIKLWQEQFYLDTLYKELIADPFHAIGKNLFKNIAEPLFFMAPLYVQRSLNKVSIGIYELGKRKKSHTYGFLLLLAFTVLILVFQFF